MSVTDNTRPPYVRFEQRAVEDREASIAAGHFVAKDVDFAVITRPGDRDSFEVEAQQWLNGLRDKARAGSIPEQWFQGFTQAYEAYKKGTELPVSGTPIKGWPVLSPAAQQSIISSGILTVEDLSTLSDSEFPRLGTGAMAYKQKAQAWLDAAKSHGKVAEELHALSVQVKQLTELSQKLAAENAELRKALPKEPAKAAF